MKPTLFFRVSAAVACTIGMLALAAPQILLGVVKGVDPTDVAMVMSRTTGVLLLCVGLMDFVVRDHPDSVTLRSVLLVNAAVHIGLLPIDVLAWAAGTFPHVGSFLPNTLIHVLFGAGALYLWRQPLD